MERHRGERSGGHPDGGRGGGSRHHPYERHNSSRTSSRSSFSSSRDDDYPNHLRQPFPRTSGSGGGPPSGPNRYPPNEDFPTYHGPVDGGGDRSAGGVTRHGSGFDDSPPSDYFSSHKRSSGWFSGPSGGFSRRGPSPDSADTGTFAKLFVGSVPRTAREEDIRPLFEEHGNVLEVALIKDKRTGQQQGCCFVKYATSEEADRAIRGLHNQCTLPGGVGPIQVRYADGERERLGAAEYKLFVGSLNKQATEKEIEDIFSPFGRVEDVYIMRDDLKQSRGCGFIKYSYREMAAAAIDALNGKFIMRGCDQPLTVRFADPKRPKAGDSRTGPAFGGPGFGQRPQMPFMNRLTPNAGDHMRLRMPDNSWHPMSPENLGGQLTQVSSNTIGGYPGARSGAAGNLGLGVLGTRGANGSLLGPALSPIPTSQQGLKPPLMQAQPSGQSLSPSQNSLASPQQMPSLQPQHTPSAYPQAQSSLTSLQFSQPLQSPLLMSQQAFGQWPPSHQLFGLNGHLPSSQTNMPQITSSTSIQPVPSSPQVQGGAVSVPHTQLGLVSTQMPQLQVHQPVAVLQQQTQTSHLRFQSPQHAFSQLQQHLHLVQTTHSQQQLTSQPIKQQSSWAGVVPQTIASTTAAAAVNVSSTITAAPIAPLSTKAEAPVTCNWTEHTSPEGYKYYYNSVTRESRWEKPEELTLFEQKQQQQQVQQMPSQLIQAQVQAQLQSPQQVSQSQQPQPQALKLQPVQMQLQQPTSTSSYPASAVLGLQNIQGLGYMQLQATGSTSDPSRLQQALAAQEWMWKNKPAGN